MVMFVRKIFLTSGKICTTWSKSYRKCWSKHDTPPPPPNVDDFATSLDTPVSSCSNTGSIWNIPYSRKNSLEVKELRKELYIVIIYPYVDLTSENQSLRSYIDKLMLVLMEKYPDALEDLEATMSIESEK